MKYLLIAKDGRHLPLKVLDEAGGQVTFVEDSSAVQLIASRPWVDDVLKEIASTGAKPQAALQAVLRKYNAQFAGSFERAPIEQRDLCDCCDYFEELRKSSLKFPGSEEDWWARPWPFTQDWVLQSLQTKLA